MLLSLLQLAVVIHQDSVFSQAPWPSHQDPGSSSTRSTSFNPSPPGSSSSPSAPIRFTALHITMIFIAILLCVVVCAIPWDNIKCGDRSSNDEAQQNQPGAGSGGAQDEEDGVRQAGLSKQMIKSLELVRYGVSSLREKAQEQAADGSIAGSCWTECMICLGEFRNGQMLRVLPRCSHGFHKKCIGQWLLSHTSCPICRDVILQLGSPGKSNLQQQRESRLENPEAHRAEAPSASGEPVQQHENSLNYNHSDMYRTYVVVVSD